MSQNSVENLSPAIVQKYEELKSILHKMGGMVIGFSGGVDSTFLLKVATDILGDKALGVIGSSYSLPQRELQDAQKLASKMSAHIRIIQTREKEDDNFVNNPLNRCFFCRSELFNKITEIAEAEGYPFIADGTNLDDQLDYRPGSVAQKKYSVRSPLLEAGLTKDEIRLLSKELGLETHDKPAYACLASRIPYGSKITEEKLTMVEQAENVLLEIGIRNMRVRHHDETARIELNTDEFQQILDPEIRSLILTKFKKIGYIYITLDLAGFRSGSLNETHLKKNQNP